MSKKLLRESIDAVAKHLLGEDSEVTPLDAYPAIGVDDSDQVTFCIMTQHFVGGRHSGTEHEKARDMIEAGLKERGIQFTYEDKFHHRVPSTGNWYFHTFSIDLNIDQQPEIQKIVADVNLEYEWYTAPTKLYRFDEKTTKWHVDYYGRPKGSTGGAGARFIPTTVHLDTTNAGTDPDVLTRYGTGARKYPRSNS